MNFITKAIPFFSSDRYGLLSVRFKIPPLLIENKHRVNTVAQESGEMLCILNHFIADLKIKYAVALSMKAEKQRYFIQSLQIDESSFLSEKMKFFLPK